MCGDGAVFKEYIVAEYIKRQAKLGRILQQNEFGEWLGLSKAQISQYINGYRVPNRDTLDLLAEKLGPQVYDAAYAKRIDPKLDKIVAAYDGVPPQEQERFTELAVKWSKELLHK